MAALALSLGLVYLLVVFVVQPVLLRRRTGRSVWLASLGATRWEQAANLLFDVAAGQGASNLDVGTGRPGRQHRGAAAGPTSGRVSRWTVDAVVGPASDQPTCTVMAAACTVPLVWNWMNSRQSPVAGCGELGVEDQGRSAVVA
ncbi:MAG: hypothetical protein ACRDQU_11565 [Pseudonocardiaceae bacterium]